ncbi:HNH endonuclease [Aerococcaceae bacterium zg-ZUI334]|uniref:HNH endonuclease n=1 Tax=Aerococcaceae bacterium zg-252 TaxID=2796928 RepID=UPI001B922575|nr:HNH endonuclease [Aerococcaceae bacterium zg-ZUI334]
MKTKFVVGYGKRYKIREDGTVFQLQGRNRYIKKRAYDNGNGYLMVNLYSGNPDDKHRAVYVHRLVALAFVDNPHNKLIVNHKDGDKKNNHVSNLEWMTAQENMEHAKQLGLLKVRERLTNEQVAIIRYLFDKGIRNIQELADEFDRSRMTIQRIVERRGYLEATDERN